MPQGRRRVPFSAKQKKIQLQQKRERKRNLVQKDKEAGGGVSDEEYDDRKSGGERSREDATKCSQDCDPKRYQLKFRKELERKKRLAGNAVQVAPEETLEIDVDEVFLPGSELDIPKRPRWNFSMSKEKIDVQESMYFQEYQQAIENKFPLEDLSFFELNLETWRQLWRVIEMADIVFIVVDIRFPSLLIPPALYDFVAQELKKDVVIVINKIDLAPPSLVVAWKHHILKRFPLVRVVCFTSFPSENVLEIDPSKRINKTKQRGRVRMAAEGASRILEVCEQIVANKIDLASWTEKINEELSESAGADSVPVAPPVTIEAFDLHYEEYERFKDKMLTVGFIGQPNVGKSSLINALVGKKVVSVSRTPGHTKHFQTIFLTNNVRLCDCPGLVFPSKVPKGLQVLAGSYPIAQLREPYSAIRFLAEHIELPKLLKLRHPEQTGPACASSDLEWSPIDICDAWAEKRGFKTAHATRNDTYRAANNLLRMALEGRLCICLRPKGYTKEKGNWESHADISDVRKIVARKQELEAAADLALSVSSSDDSQSEEEEDSLTEGRGGDERDTSEENIPRSSASNQFALLDDDD